MDNIWCSSDLHFGHDRQFMYGPRGFSSIEEHDATIIENWNKIVKPNDTVYLLGDLMLNDNENGIKKLNQLILFSISEETIVAMLDVPYIEKRLVCSRLVDFLKQVGPQSRKSMVIMYIYLIIQLIPATLKTWLH